MVAGAVVVAFGVQPVGAVGIVAKYGVVVVVVVESGVWPVVVRPRAMPVPFRACSD